MWQSAVNTGKQAFYTTFPYFVYRYKRSDELKIRQYRVECEFNKLHGTDKMHPLEQLALKETLEQKVQREDCPVLNGEAICVRQLKVAAKFVKASAEKFME